jgi:hypothetical protein
MTGLAAKRWLIHIGNPAITRGAHDNKVDEGGDHDKIDAVSKPWIAQVNNSERWRGFGRWP